MKPKKTRKGTPITYQDVGTVILYAMVATTVIFAIIGFMGWFQGRNNSAIAPLDPDLAYLQREVMPPRENATPYWDRPENQEELKKIEADHEASKKKWLDENPPVRRLFDEDRISDTAYVIEYLKENKIGGHCALVWLPDVVCTDRDSITFPTSRE